MGQNSSNKQNPVGAKLLDVGDDDDSYEAISAVCIPEDAPQAMHYTHEHHSPASSPEPSQQQQQQQGSTLRPSPTDHGHTSPAATEPSVRRYEPASSAETRRLPRHWKRDDGDATDGADSKRKWIRSLGRMLVAIIGAPLLAGIVLAWSFLGLFLTCPPWLISLAWSGICAAVLFGASSGSSEWIIGKVR
jgi:hypothetical protein